MQGAVWDAAQGLIHRTQSLSPHAARGQGFQEHHIQMHLYLGSNALFRPISQFVRVEKRRHATGRPCLSPPGATLLGRCSRGIAIALGQGKVGDAATESQALYACIICVILLRAVRFPSQKLPMKTCSHYIPVSCILVSLYPGLTLLENSSSGPTIKNMRLTMWVALSALAVSKIFVGTAVLCTGGHGAH